METISSAFKADHRSCDELFSSAEECVQGHDWAKASEVFADFAREMERHFGKEENVLFPALVERTAGAMGPTQVMRMEHKDMRQLMADMQEDLGQQDAEHFLGLSETLLVMMQQHNNKEENILYQMADRVLAGDQGDVLERARALDD